MATFDITVDTSPMANSLDHVNSNVRDVTASVVAMESAVVIAQQEASDHICKNVDTGFFISSTSSGSSKNSNILSAAAIIDCIVLDICAT